MLIAEALGGVDEFCAARRAVSWACKVTLNPRLTGPLAGGA